MDMMKDLTTTIDSKFQRIQKEIKDMRGGNHSSSECDNKPMGGPEAEANYVYGGYRGGGYRGSQPRDENCPSTRCHNSQFQVIS